MVDSNEHNLEPELRKRVRQFLSDDHSSRNRAVISTIRRIRDHNWDAVLFGGTLRDLMVYGVSNRPRDIDIVVAGATTNQLSEVFADSISKRTRFGGLHLQYRGWMFDVWPLSDTWAFKQPTYTFGCDFASLPKTTFLNVEAVAIELRSTRGKSRPIHSYGFFESVANRMLDINFEDNPFPALCIVRTLVTAARLQFSIGKKLAGYLVHYSNIYSPEELVDVQLKHYGSCQRTAIEFHSWLSAVQDQYRSGLTGTSVACLPTTRAQQLDLFNDWTPAW